MAQTADTSGEARYSIFLNITQLLCQDQLSARRGMHVPVGCVKALVEGCLAVQQAGWLASLPAQLTETAQSRQVSAAHLAACHTHPTHRRAPGWQCGASQRSRPAVGDDP